MHFDVLIYPGFDELDALAPWEILAGLAGRMPEQHSAALVSLDGSGPITASHGTVLQPLGALSERPDVIVVPGGPWVDYHPGPGTRAAAEEGSVPAALAERHARGTVVASVCTGAMLLAAAGLLDDRPATTHHGAVEDLRATGAVIVEGPRVVDDGDVITAGGVTCGLDMALWLLERFVGPQAALDAERGLEYERRGTVWRAAG